MRIRILVRLYRHKKFNFYVTNIHVVIGHKTNLYKSTFERLEIRFICLFWSMSLLLDPDPHSQYEYGYRKAKLMRIRIHNTAIYVHKELLNYNMSSERTVTIMTDLDARSIPLQTFLKVKKSSGRQSAISIRQEQL
jgi:hypothetical protein